MILEMFAVFMIMVLLAVVGAAIGYGAYRLGQNRRGSDWRADGANLAGGKRGLIVTSYDPGRRMITFYADQMTCRPFRQFGRFIPDGMDEITGDPHWALAVSRFYSYSDVLNSMMRMANEVSPHQLDTPALPRPGAVIPGQYRLMRERV